MAGGLTPELIEGLGSAMQEMGERLEEKLSRVFWHARRWGAARHAGIRGDELRGAVNLDRAFDEAIQAAERVREITLAHRYLSERLNRQKEENDGEDGRDGPL